ncbi:hypothetical protein [Kocuria oceani]|uniref:Uncharacterized protein n=1 Tax=Kocuria oceani TaxID=988827 RepID=A0ABV9THQ8_9MICC|nr:hypothetical protein [Kocuria oceani]
MTRCPTPSQAPPGLVTWPPAAVRAQLLAGLTPVPDTGPRSPFREPTGAPRPVPLLHFPAADVPVPRSRP